MRVKSTLMKRWKEKFPMTMHMSFQNRCLICKREGKGLRKIKKRKPKNFIKISRMVRM